MAGRARRVGMLVVVVGLVGLVGAKEGRAQEVAVGSGALALFLDCQAMGCFDLDFLRREIPVVDWMRDREASELHILITAQGTGGGGRLYTMAFIGRGAREGQDQELTISTGGDTTPDEERQAVADRLKLGLVRYLADTEAADDIVVSLGSQGPPGGAGFPGGPRPPDPPQEDPWDYWVFRVSGSTSLSGESSSSFSNSSASLSANRTTEELKFSTSASFRRSRQEFDFVEGEPPVVALIEDWSASSLLVKSLTEKWSLGTTLGAGRSTRLNQNFRFNLSPGIEYNVFPYSESSRRAFTLQALINLRHWDYENETIYLVEEETRVAASLTASLNQIEPWGRANLSITGSQYLHDADLNQVSLFGFIQFRAFRGFSVSLNGRYSWVRDQLYLESGDATTEEVLLRQRQLQTNYTYSFSVSLSYQFGSLLNNVVNPRFGGSSGGILFF